MTEFILPEIIVDTECPYDTAEKHETDRRLVSSAQRLDLEDPFASVDAKISILRITKGYTHLTGEGGQRIRLENCSPRRINGAVKSSNQAAQNRLAQYNRLCDKIFSSTS